MNTEKTNRNDSLHLRALCITIFNLTHVYVINVKTLLPPPCGEGEKSSLIGMMIGGGRMSI